MRGGLLPYLIAGSLVVAAGTAAAVGVGATPATGASTTDASTTDASATNAPTSRHEGPAAVAPAPVLRPSGSGASARRPFPAPAPGGETATRASAAAHLIDVYAGAYRQWAFTQTVCDSAEMRVLVESTTGPPPDLVQVLRARGLSRYVTYRTVRVSRSSFYQLADQVREATKTATVPVSVISMGPDADSIEVSFRRRPTAGDLRLLPKLAAPVHHVGVADPVDRPAPARPPERRTSVRDGSR